MNKAIAVVLGMLMLVSCNKNDEAEPVAQFPKIETISLNYHSSEQTCILPRNAEQEGCTLVIKDDSYWISKLKLKGNEISFNVIENTETEKCHRFDTILIISEGIRVGSLCVSQARKPVSASTLAWANENALYRNSPASSEKLSGLEMTKLIYNLEKTTNGKDSYKNYPAFAFCIEMNHDPENNMEWYLPSISEMQKYASGQSYEGTPFYQHNYWWSSTENTLNGNAYSLYSKSIASRGAENKSGKWWVMAFRNGKMDEI